MLQLGLDGILVDARRETEHPREFAKRPLAAPVFGLRLVVALLLAVLLGLRLLVLLPGPFNPHRLRRQRRIALSVRALGMAADDQGLRVGELDDDVLARHARQLALQEVMIFVLGDVELGAESLAEGPEGPSGKDFQVALGVLVEVVEHAEERGESGCVHVVSAAGRGQRHVVVGEDGFGGEASVVEWSMGETTRCVGCKF